MTAPFVNATPAEAGDAMSQLTAAEAPIVVVLIAQEGCPACEQYHPTFVKAATPYQARGLPFVLVDAATPNEEAQAWMALHGVTATPTVLVVQRYRGAIGRLEGVSTDVDTRRLLDLALANNVRRPVW